MSAPGLSSPSRLTCVQSARVYGLSPRAQPRMEGQGVSAEPVEPDGSPGSRLSWPPSQGPGAPSQLLLGFAGVQPTVLSPRAPPVSDGSLCVTQTSAPSTVPPGGLQQREHPQVSSLWTKLSAGHLIS